MSPGVAFMLGAAFGVSLIGLILLCARELDRFEASQEAQFFARWEREEVVGDYDGTDADPNARESVRSYSTKPTGTDLSGDDISVTSSPHLRVIEGGER